MALGLIGICYLLLYRGFRRNDWLRASRGLGDEADLSPVSGRTSGRGNGGRLPLVEQPAPVGPRRGVRQSTLTPNERCSASSDSV
jgi:hypothetical protein